MAIEVNCAVTSEVEVAVDDEVNFGVGCLVVDVDADVLLVAGDYFYWLGSIDAVGGVGVVWLCLCPGVFVGFDTREFVPTALIVGIH